MKFKVVGCQNIQMAKNNSIRLCIVLLLALLTHQQVDWTKVLHQVDGGKWLSPAEIKEPFPRFLICGAEMNYFRENEPYSCKVEDKGRTFPVNITCAGGRPVWERSNGIKIRYCDFQDWDNQKGDMYYGDWGWMGMKMCPKGQYVYNYMTRVSDVDGLSGLILFCRNFYSNESSTVTVKEGKGTLKATDPKDIKPNLFAFDFNIKVRSEGSVSFITGLHMYYTPFPEITKVDVKFDTLAPPQINLEYQSREPIRFENKKNADQDYEYDVNKDIRKMIQAHNSRPGQRQSIYGFYMTDFKVRYQGGPLRKQFSPALAALKLNQPILVSKSEEALDIDRAVVFRIREVGGEFQFSKTFNLNVPSYEMLKYKVAACWKLEISVSIYSATIFNNYTASITYTSGSTSFTTKYRGVYVGSIFGRPEVRTDYSWIC